MSWHTHAQLYFVLSDMSALLLLLMLHACHHLGHVAAALNAAWAQYMGLTL